MPRFTSILEMIDALGSHVEQSPGDQPGLPHELVDSPIYTEMVHRFVCLRCREAFEIPMRDLTLAGRAEVTHTAADAARVRLFAEYMSTTEGRQTLAHQLQRSRGHVTPESIAREQQRLGVTPDGIDGPRTRAAGMPLVRHGEVQVNGPPHFIGQMPIRSELTVLSADDPNQRTVGFRMRIGVVSNLNGITHLVVTGVGGGGGGGSSAPQVAVGAGGNGSPTPPRAAETATRAYPTRFDREEPL